MYSCFYTCLASFFDLLYSNTTANVNPGLYSTFCTVSHTNYKLLLVLYIINLHSANVQVFCRIDSTSQEALNMFTFSPSMASRRQCRCTLVTASSSLTFSYFSRECATEAKTRLFASFASSVKRKVLELKKYSGLLK